MDEDNYYNNENNEEEPLNEPTCARCGFRTYSDPCPSCGAPMVDHKDDEDEEHDWRERR